MLDFSRLEELIQREMAAAIVPGLALAIVRGDEVVYARGFGVKEKGGTACPVTPETVFRIGSVTKPMTGTMILRLVEAGILDLDAPITDAVPWLTVGEPNVAAQITLRMLLSHTAGLPTLLHYTPSPGVNTLEDYARIVIPRLKLVVPPGTAYAYSNPGINLAGYIAEAVTQTPYGDLMREWVFEPLAMRHTTFDPLMAMTYPLSQSFVLDAKAQPYVKRPFIDNPAEYPCGFAMSTALDLANFAQLHLNKGSFKGEQILRPATIDAMHAPHAPLMTPDERAYGLTVRTRTYKGVRLVGHNGGIAKYGAVWLLAPDEQIGVVMLFNRAPGFWGAADAISSHVLDRLLDLSESVPLTPIVAPDRSPWRAYEGSYLGSGAGLAVIAAADDCLMLTLNGEAIPLDRVSGDCYSGRKPGGGSVSVGFLPGAADQTKYLMMDGMLCARFDQATAPDVGTWAEHAGIYRGDIDIWTLRFADGQLLIYSDDERTEVPCIPLDEHRFACAFGLFEFACDANGRAVALRGGGGEWRFQRVNVP